MKPLNQKLLQRFVALASERLTGEWVLVGGSLLPLLGHEYRSTVDIDLVPVGTVKTDQQLKLMEICEELGLPVETVNTAAEYFLKKIVSYERHLVPLSGKIYRPTAFLYLMLKIPRLSDSDLADCIEMLKAHGDELVASERSLLAKRIKKDLGAARGQPKEPRLRALLSAILAT